jgi:hypothetical protein
MKKLLVLCLTAALTVLGFTAHLKAAEESPDKPPKSENKNRYVPFHGKVDHLDKAGRTLKIGQRTFHVTDATKITKAGKTATFDETAVGEEVGGAYQQGEGGRLELTSLRIGPKGPKESKPSESKPEQP